MPRIGCVTGESLGAGLALELMQFLDRSRGKRYAIALTPQPARQRSTQSGTGADNQGRQDQPHGDSVRDLLHSFD